MATEQKSGLAIWFSSKLIFFQYRVISVTTLICVGEGTHFSNIQPYIWTNSVFWETIWDDSTDSNYHWFLWDVFLYRYLRISTVLQFSLCFWDLKDIFLLNFYPKTKKIESFDTLFSLFSYSGAVCTSSLFQQRGVSTVAYSHLTLALVKEFL